MDSLILSNSMIRASWERGYEASQSMPVATGCVLRPREACLLFRPFQLPQWRSYSVTRTTGRSTGRATGTSRADPVQKIDALPDELREPLMLYYFDEITYEQIADILGVSRATVYTRLAKARRHLAKRLADESTEVARNHDGMQ